MATDDMQAQADGAGEATRKELARFILEQLKERRLPKDRALAFLQELSARPDSTPGPAGRAADGATGGDIAIVGMACRFPDAASTGDFWRNLRAGRSSIGPFPAGRRADLAALDGNRTELFRGGFLESVDGFDHEYFQVPPNVARRMDPYQRLLLETLVETIEDAGYHRGALHGAPVGVFVGNDHTHRLFNSYVDFIDDIDFHAVTGSWTAVLASRISYLFNFKGPAVVVDTACSSGLAALDGAIKALRDGDCEAALVGAVNLFFAPGKGLVGEIENERFEVRAFDRGASGTVWGEGLAAVMLKPLAAAQRDGDAIHAVIRGVALNNDGASNGLTAPNAKAQQEVILKAWERAGIRADDLSYIETHGTGTHLGDPIEIKGLIGAFERHSRRRQFCGIGSVKTNIGHTVGVAGLASLIKVVLGLEHGELPPSLHFDQPNPYIDFCNSPVFVNDRLRPWPAGDAPRVAGISSFSLSGTNCHLVVQEAPRPPARAPAAGPRLLPLSARSRALLAETVRRLRAHLDGREPALADLCYTASVGREHHACRAALVAASVDAVRAGLDRLAALLAAGADAADDGTLFLRADGCEEARGEREARDAAVKGARAGSDSALADLARLYVRGAPVKWETLYEGEPVRRAHLPAQPFARRRFWDKAAGPAPDALHGKAPAAGTGHADSVPTDGHRDAGAAGEGGSGRVVAGGNAVRDEMSRAGLLAAVAQEPPRIAMPDGRDAPMALRVVARLWSEVLGYDRLRPTDDFYALGGDSISGMKIVHLLQAIFGMHVPLSELLGAADLAGFAATLAERHGLAALLEEGHAAVHAGTPDAGGRAASEAIPPAPDAPGHAYPLSRAQSRMFLLDRLSPGMTAYNVNALVALDALPDPAQTAAIVRRLVERHEILRTGFAMHGEQAVQVVHPAACAEAFRAGVHLLPADATDADVQAAARALVRPFDLSRPPLLRIDFLRAGSRAWMLIDMHHIVTDGSSMGVLVAEFLALQAGAALPALPCQYKDFAAWQNGRFAAGAWQEQADWWHARFADGVPVLDLPADFPRPAMRDFRGARRRHAIGGPLAGALRELARAQGTTLFAVLLAAFKTLLYRLGAGSDIVVGTPVAGRSHHALHGLVGMFVNTLALRDRIEEGDSFAGFLARVKRNTLDALARQDHPYEDLVDSLALPRDAGRNPLFDVYFVLQNEDMGLEARGAARVLPLDAGTAKFDLTVVARPVADGLEIEWEYATALFHAGTVDRLAAQYEQVLRAIVADPARPLDAIDPTTDAARRLLARVNDTATAYPRERSLADLFSEQAALFPGAPALEQGDAVMTYAELERRANRLAHRLLAEGVGCGEPVALLHGRSFAMVEAILAVLKAGAAYVPLDPAAPAERNGAILAESGARLLLAGEGMEQAAAEVLAAARASAGDGAQAARVLPAADDLSGLPDTRPAVEVGGADLAYLIFTSGSTGRPKGTLIRHRSAVRVVRDAGYLAPCPADRILQLSTIAFDGSVFDLWAALANGGCLVLPTREALADMSLLPGLIRARRISVFFVTTALFNALVDLDPGCLGGVRHVLFGGEACSPRHVARAFAALGPGRLIHVYGPTETTVFATAHRIDALPDDGRTVPIGHPIGNTTCHVLDASLRPVPFGAPGELCIGGDGVALGYLGREDLARERFVPDPFAAGGMLYRTGDIVRWDDAGRLVFLGRRDHQVKIRGYRIELAEIESALGSHPAVRDCLVAAGDDGQGGKRLVAYAVSPENAGGDAFAAELRAFLAARLPGYMVPSAIAVLDAFPLNANGKIDRRALPAPQDARRQSQPPRDAREALLARTWEEVLGCGGVGVHDNYFAVGGDSIRAIQIVARVRAAGHALEMPMLFRHQTIAELAPLLAPLDGDGHAYPASAAAAAQEAREDGAPAYSAGALDSGELDDIFSDLNLA